MKRKTSFIKSILLTIASLIIGFIAIAFPFNLFSALSSEAMHIVFISEIIIYFSISMVFLALKDRKAKEKEKLEKRHQQRREKIQRVKTDWIDIAA